jgi:NTP pyrophosphatase (non-canonical NTP hydrolase)
MGAQASAQSEQETVRLKNALNNVQQEMMECAAYYVNLAACLAISNEQKTSDEMRKASPVS